MAHTSISLRSHLLAPLALLASLVACAAPPTSEARLVGPTAKADGSGPGALFVCRVERGEGEGFFRTDTLRCEVPEEATLRDVTLEVRSTEDRFVGSGRLVDGPLSLRVSPELYPLTVAAAVTPERGSLLGLDGVRIRGRMTVEGAEANAAPLGPELPFEIWELRLESTVSFAALRVDEYELVAAGAELESGGQRAASLAVRPSPVSFDLGEVQVVRVAVGRGTEALTGSAGPVDSEVPFTIDRPGRYRVTAAGLVPDTAPPPRLEPARTPFLSCYGFGALEACRVVSRPGVTLRSAEVLVDGETVDLPLDGFYADIPRGERVAGRVVLDDGVHGLSLSAHGVIEGALTPVRDEDARPGEVAPDVAVLEAPFDLLHAVINVPPGAGGLIDAEAHTVTLPSGATTATISAYVSEATADVWVAVDRDVDSVAVDATLLGVDGSVIELPDQTLRAATLFLRPDGLGAPPAAAPVDELFGCWLERSNLHCAFASRRDIESASVTVHLTGAGPAGVAQHDLNPSPLSETVPMQDLDGFFPLTLELRATDGAGVERAAQARVRGPEDLPEGSRVYVDAG